MKGVVQSLVGVILGCVAGSTLGGFVGYWIGTASAVKDKENTWALALIVGGAAGIALSVAVLLRRARKLGWAWSLLAGGGCGTASAALVLLFLLIFRR